MSTITLKRIFLPMLSALALTSCFSPAEDNADAIDESAATTRLKVTTRAASGEVTYPILVMAYDESGALKGEQTINSERPYHCSFRTRQLHRTLELQPAVGAH